MRRSSHTDRFLAPLPRVSYGNTNKYSIAQSTGSKRWRPGRSRSSRWAATHSLVDPIFSHMKSMERV